jgi:hypothetical protein
MAQGDLKSISPKLEKYRGWLEGHARYLDDKGGFYKSIVRPEVGYSFAESAAVWLGYAWIRESPKGKEDFDEHRIWQQLTWSKTLNPIVFSIRSRLEQRFVETGSETGWRFRQFFKLEYPFPFEPRLSLLGADELFFNLNNTDWGADSGFAQNRLFGGVGWKFDTKGRLKAEAGYLNQFIDKVSGDDRMNHIFFVALFLNF